MISNNLDASEKKLSINLTAETTFSETISNTNFQEIKSKFFFHFEVRQFSYFGEFKPYKPITSSLYFVNFHAFSFNSNHCKTNTNRSKYYYVDT